MEGEKVLKICSLSLQCIARYVTILCMCSSFFFFFFRKHVGSVMGKYFGLNHTVSRKKLFGRYATNDQTGVFTFN